MHQPRFLMSRTICQKAAYLLAFLFFLSLGTAKAQTESLGTSSIEYMPNNFMYTTSLYDVDWTLAFGSYSPDDCYVTDPTFTDYYNGGMLIGLRSSTPPTPMTKAEFVKIKGYSKFDPFQGADAARIVMGNQLLAGPALTEGIQTPTVCVIGQPCAKSSGQWTIKAGDPKKQEGFTICSSGKKNACLCYTPEEGLIVRTASGSAADGACSQWILQPGNIGGDGAIKSYLLRPKAHADHVLVLDEQTNQVQVVKGDQLAKNKKLRSEWTFDAGKKTKTVQASDPKVEKN